eukprot:jgi/Tetstr1/425992/TSEL_016341.t1
MLIPYMDDFMFFASSPAHAYALRDRLTSLLGILDLSQQLDKGQWEPAQRLEHLGMELDSRSGTTTEARGFKYDCDHEPHITYKELKAVQYAVLNFLSELRGRQVLLLEDNMGVVQILANLTSRSPLLMTKLGKLWFILDSNDISISARYIKTTANIGVAASAARLTTTTGRSAYAT